MKILLQYLITANKMEVNKNAINFFLWRSSVILVICQKRNLVLLVK